MRKALNENPMVQMGVLAVCGVVFAFILFTMVLKKEEPPATDPAAPVAATGATATTDPAATATADPAASATVTPPATPPPVAAPTPPSGGSISDGLLPSKGLPKEILLAFAKNQTIALLVIDPGNSSDKRVEAYTKAAEAREDVEVFIVDVDDIAKYSRITSGVSTSRVPALIVIKPRKLSGSVPTASVAYGFRGARSVDQALDDALYDGKQLPSFPADKKSKKKQGN